MARLAAGAAGDAGPLQPAVVGDPEPLFQELALALQRFQPVVVPQSEPASVQAPVPVPVPQAPPEEEVQALLAVLLAEPLAVPQPARPLGEALRRLQERRRVSLAGPDAQPLPVPVPVPVVLPESLCDNAGAALLRLWSHGVPGGAQELARQIQDEVAEPDALPLE